MLEVQDMLRLLHELRVLDKVEVMMNVMSEKIMKNLLLHQTNSVSDHFVIRILNDFVE